MPRLRGRVYQQGRPWTWELIITIGSGPGDSPDPIILRPPRPTFLNKLAALNDLRAHAVNIIREIASAVGARTPAEVIDLIANERKSLEEFSRPAVPGGSGGA